MLNIGTPVVMPQRNCPRCPKEQIPCRYGGIQGRIACREVVPDAPSPIVKYQVEVGHCLCCDLEETDLGVSS